VLNGAITEAEARVHPERNVITRAVGTSKYVDIDLLRIHLKPNDMYLLCSDGLSGAMYDEEMLDILESRQRGSAKVASLIKKALVKSHDNITAMLVSFEEDKL